LPIKEVPELAQPLALFESIQPFRRQTRTAIRGSPNGAGHGTDRIRISTTGRDELLHYHERLISKS
jgi:hypothetical protein